MLGYKCWEPSYWPSLKKFWTMYTPEAQKPRSTYTNARAYFTRLMSTSLYVTVRNRSYFNIYTCVHISWGVSLQGIDKNTWETWFKEILGRDGKEILGRNGKEILGRNGKEILGKVGKGKRKKGWRCKVKENYGIMKEKV